MNDAPSRRTNVLVAIVLVLNIIVLAALLWPKPEPPPDNSQQYYSEAASEQFELFQPQRDFVFVGDSLTERGRWHDIFPEASIANRGVGGETVADILKRVDSINALKPKRVFLMAGINDFRAGRTVDEVERDYRELLRRLDGDVIAIATIECDCPANPAVREFNRRFKWDVDLNPDMTRAELGPDGLHLSGSGYQLWARHLAPYFD